MMNLSSGVVLAGFEGLFSLRWPLVGLLLSLWLFELLVDALVIFVIISRPVLHKPIFVFIAAVLLNSLVASSVIYPRLLWDLGRVGPGLSPGSELDLVRVSVRSCLTQAFLLHVMGSSSFMLLGAMSLDRYLSIMCPMQYVTLMSPRRVLCLLLVCWFCPLAMVGVVIALVSRLPLCANVVYRIYCDPYTIIGLSCPGPMAQLAVAYGFFLVVVVLFVPGSFVLFSYGRILWVCLFRSRSFSRKALETCGPHIAVFLNYLLSTAFDLLHRRVSSSSRPSRALEGLATAASLFSVMVPTVLNPLVYGLKVTDIYRQITKLLRR
ncbi:olfactory receptor 11A1-like [Eucyclogobius newberryi]|uniref:olfactory receptor 11A1-like n=1 Tax=Eucyclogobius newberryi TaxID=166745 RepID=UPI003B5AF8D6